MQVDDIGWEDGRLVVTGRANVPSVDIPRRRNTSKIVVLRPPGRRLPVVLPVRSFLNPEATALSEQDRYNYDWSGFRFAVSPRRFRGTGEWQCYMLVRGHGVWRPGPGAHPGARPRRAAAAPSGGARPAVRRPLGRPRPEPGGVAARRDGRGRRLAGRRPAGGADRRRAARGRHRLRPPPPRPAPDYPRPGRARAGPQPRRGDPVSVPGTTPALPSPDRGTRPDPFSAVVPLGDLAGATDVVDRVGRAAGDDGMAWDVYLKRPGRPRVRVAWPDGMAETRHLFGAREAVVGQSRYGDLVIAERTPRPVIDEHEWQPDGRLVLRGSFLGVGAGPGGDRYETVLRRVGSADSHVIGFAVDGRAVQHRGRPGPDAVLRLGHPAAGRRMEPVRPPGGRRTGRAGRAQVRPRPARRRQTASGSPPGASGTG